MKDKAVGSDKPSSDDFDLDSFLRENNFLSDESDHEERKEESRANKTTSTKRPTKNAKAASASTGSDPNATMSYKAADLDYPEFPFVGEDKPAKPSRITSSRKKASAEKSSVANEDLGATQLMTALDTGNIKSDLPATKSKTKASKSSAASGKKTLTDTSAANAKSISADAKNVSETSSGTDSKTSSGVLKPASRNGKPVPAKTDVKSKTGSMPAKKTTTAGKGTVAQKKGRANTATNAKAVKNKPHLQTLANPKDFHIAEIDGSTYHIRGGGTRHNKRTPMLVIVVAAVIIVALAVSGTVLANSYFSMLEKNTVKPVVTLTSSDTRPAIDAQMPKLLDHVNGSAQEAYDKLLASGWPVHIRSRATQEDPNNTGGVIAKVSPELSDEALSVYFEKEFNGFNFDDLQNSFNGSWLLDIAHGSEGALTQLKYLNFAVEATADAADPLMAELKHLRTLQGLAGEGSVVISEGQDDFNNSYIQGTITINETKYYWKIVGIAFKEYYGGDDNRDLPATSVFVRCSVGTYNFYGGEEPPANNGAATT